MAILIFQAHVVTPSFQTLCNVSSLSISMLGRGFHFAMIGRALGRSIIQRVFVSQAYKLASMAKYDHPSNNAGGGYIPRSQVHFTIHHLVFL